MEAAAALTINFCQDICSCFSLSAPRHNPDARHYPAGLLDFGIPLAVLGRDDDGVDGPEFLVPMLAMVLAEC